MCNVKQQGFVLLAAVGFLLAVFVTNVLAHQGHRFVIKTDSGKLFAQGVNTESPARFNEPRVRPYRNVIHHNWTNFAFNGVSTAISLLPGFDIPVSETTLIASNISIRLNQIVRWNSPPKHPADETTPVWRKIGDEVFTITLGVYRIGTVNNSANTLLLASRISPSGMKDIDPKYQLASKVTDSIYVLDLTLSTTAQDIADSDSVYIILGPPGYAYHETLMYLERYLSVNGIESVLDAEAGKLFGHKTGEYWVMLAVLLVLTAVSSFYVFVRRKNIR